jgi:asparagine synthase (glutamine-hydrolysing)
MCHSLLRTVEQHERELQPISLRHLTITADARIDAQDELIGRIRAKGAAAAPGMSDAELILAAYDAWGENCVDFLLGDFSFAIWDGKRQQFFLARDQLGVKPFFYFLSDEVCVFSNTLDCVLIHPAVPDRLSDRAIADFLLFGILRDHSATVYDEIHRLPPGHSMVVSRDGIAMREYWELPIDEPLYLGRPKAYVEQFLDHLNVAVADRLRVPTVGILMSGGLDSPSVAAAASKILRGRHGVESVRAFSNSQPAADDEHKYAQLVAEALGIPIEFHENRDVDAPADWTDSRLHTPQPVPFANYTAGFRDRCRTYSSHSRVAFYGEGPDNALMFEWKSHCRELLRSGRFVRAATDIVIDAFLHRKIPTPSGLFSTSTPQTRQFADDDVPVWMNEDFERSVGARGRVRELHNRRSRLHPYRPLAYQSIRETFWGSLFESYDSASTLANLEMRHPYADLRMLRFLLAVPVLPWCRGKYLIRSSMRGTLPDRVLNRPKSPLMRELWSERVLSQGRPKLVACEELERYIDLERFAKSGESDEDFWTDFRVASLSFWLTNKNARQTRTEKAR